MSVPPYIHQILTEPRLTVVQTKSTKRKLDDALHSLDQAIQPVDVSEPAGVSTPSSKRARITRSIYSTLAKYGIKSKDPGLSTTSVKIDVTLKSTPHLAAILSRKASRTHKSMPFKLNGKGQNPATQSNSSISTSEYRPSSIQSFLSGLSSFKISTYTIKPSAIDAVAAAKCGWSNDGKDHLVCAMCNSSWVVVGREGMSRDAANSLLEKQKASMIDMHKDGCPWKVRQCYCTDIVLATIYCIPLKPPSSLAKDIKARALELDAVMDGVEIRHPLTSPQVRMLISTMAAIPTLPVETDEGFLQATYDGTPGSTNPPELPQTSEPASV
ncbi:hypothetical protein BD410DRAFT_804562 [Rickenella mellea]|uniref:C3HC-type domain-containing protein n=1 Tax=Rickenella mellea TaxID=50990 RepID=A0A4Y7Q174_9AGAM|nr:hypothetical protein BD410DRAFT_804562 [Rickenella mellea]